MNPYLQVIIVGTIVTLVILALVFGIPLVVKGYLKMTVPSHLAVGSAIQINGTSTPSNSTHTNCRVDIIINNQSYAATNPTGKNGSFSTWNYLSGPVVKPGENRVTAKYSCFAPTNSTLPNFEYHHSMNIMSDNSGNNTRPTGNVSNPFFH